MVAGRMAPTFRELGKPSMSGRWSGSIRGRDRSEVPSTAADLAGSGLKFALGGNPPTLSSGKSHGERELR